MWYTYVTLKSAHLDPSIIVFVNTVIANLGRAGKCVGCRGIFEDQGR